MTAQPSRQRHKSAPKIPEPKKAPPWKAPPTTTTPPSTSTPTTPKPHPSRDTRKRNYSPADTLPWEKSRSPYAKRAVLRTTPEKMRQLNAEVSATWILNEGLKGTQDNVTPKGERHLTERQQRLVARLPPEQQTDFVSVLRAVGRDIDAGVVAANHVERKRYWSHWCTFIKPFDGVDPMLTDLPNGDRIDLLCTFARRVREGHCGKGHRVRAATVQVALRAIGTTFEMDGRPNPTYRHDSQCRYWKPIARLIESYRRADPPPQHKLAIPVTVVNHLYEASTLNPSPKAQATADLCLIAFYYLLRVGEYTSHKPDAKRRTKQFRAQDITFWDADDNIIPNTAPLTTLLTAHSATMRITNQKNGTRGSLINHTATYTRACPIRALARRVHHIMSHPTGKPSDIISTYFDNSTKHTVSTSMISNAIKTAVRALGLDKKGFRPELVSSHSLRAGGAMAMHLNNIDSSHIRKMGRWSSDTFLMYIHEQIAAFSAGLSTKMATEIAWHNIEGPTYPAHAPTA